MAVIVDPDKCTGCGACKDVCPSDAITIENEKAVINENCIDCGACIPVCPTEAITPA